MFQENLSRVRERIQKAAQRANRRPEEITLISVTKAASLDEIAEAIAHGITDIGENRVAEAFLKYGQLGDEARRLRWHMIGHLQANKAKKAIEIFDIIHSLDSMRLAHEIEDRAASAGKRIDCLIEVNTSNEASKYGVRPDEAEALIRNIATLPHIHIIGLMTMAPMVTEAELARPYFSILRTLRDRIQAMHIPNTDIQELSMGMSQDFEVAVEEGATMLRIGTALFLRVIP